VKGFEEELHHDLVSLCMYAFNCQWRNLERFCTCALKDSKTILSTSVQGCCLNVSFVGARLTGPGQEACAQLRSTVLAQRGSRDMPTVRVQGT
jgi:hypothetical protein